MSVKRNNLRLYYLLYILIMTITVSIIFIIALKVNYYKIALLKSIFIFLLIKFALQIICLINRLKKVSKNEDDKNIDERECFIISKATSIGGFVAFTLTPLVYLFVLIIPKYLPIAATIYALLIDTTINIAIVVYQKKV